MQLSIHRGDLLGKRQRRNNMGLPWWQVENWVNKDAGSAASDAASALSAMQREKENLEAERQRQEEQRQQDMERAQIAQQQAQQDYVLKKIETDAQRRAATQLESYGIPATPSNIKSQVNSKFSWAQQEIASQQQKNRQDVIADLLKNGVIDYTMPQEQREVMIQVELKRKQAEQAIMLLQRH